MLKNRIYLNFLIEIAKNFLLFLFIFSLIAITVRAVNFLDLIVDSGYPTSTYFTYIIFNFFGMIPKFVPISFLIALMMFVIKHNDGEVIGDINRLNEMIKDPKWLENNREAVTIAGPRIPTDATNSVEFAEVWHFLDPSAGNKIIVPTEIVAKAGSDFDVDKLFFMYPALDTDGKVIKTKYTQEQLDSEIERGEVKASLISSKELSPTELNEISKNLSESMESKIIFDYKLDKELIGGLKLQVGSFMIDTSIKNRLNKYKQAMLED